MGCCCGPYPIIDLTAAFTKQEGFAATETVRNELKVACRRYGCFHVSISTSTSSAAGNISNDNDNESPPLLSVLSSENEVKQRIESLFEEDFLDSIEGNNNNGPVVASFQDDGDNNRSISNNNNRNSSAVYRGRNAESGSSTNSSAEPKQSWELFRCSSSNERKGNDNGNDNCSSDNSNLNNVKKNERLQNLRSFVTALHKVAETLCSKDLLDLPEDKFICSSTSASSTPENISPKSTDTDMDMGTDISLLRVFRYDALSTQEEQYSNLGSSSHTDWGTLTVVWQDSKGGLQMYCHKHQRWNDVEVVEGKGIIKSADGSDSADGADDTTTIRLFIHVGDYLSLAMNAVAMKNEEKEKNKSHQNVIWPSPFHRVLCPLRIDNSWNNNDADNSRCSLVYFAYPKNGVTLLDAISSLHKKEKEGGGCEGTNFTMADYNEDNEQDEDEDQSTKEWFPFSRYMLLKDQSVEMANKNDTDINNPDKTAQQNFNRIMHLPFNKVIEQKWSQVQRS